MAFELDPCLVRTSDGELIARGFVREQHGTSVVVEAKTFSGTFLEPGDPAVLEIQSDDRGAMTYDAVVSSAFAKRIGLAGLVLRTVVQQRAALRVLVVLALEINLLPLPDDPDVAPTVVGVRTLDVSAHGLRIRTPLELEVGARFTFGFVAARVPLNLTAEVLRVEQVRDEHAYGCRLVGASERESDLLFRFVLDEQRRQLAERARDR